MKKLISMLLLVSMLLSMAVMPASADEAGRDLTLRENTHISLEANADVDVFASFESVAEYSRFNSPIVKSTGSHFEKVTYTVNGEEKEVFNYLILNYSTGEISRLMGISEKTVRNHVSNVIQKLGVNNRTQAMVELLKLGEISLL